MPYRQDAFWLVKHLMKPTKCFSKNQKYKILRRKNIGRTMVHCWWECTLAQPLRKKCIISSVNLKTTGSRSFISNYLSEEKKTLSQKVSVHLGSPSTTSNRYECNLYVNNKWTKKEQCVSNKYTIEYHQVPQKEQKNFIIYEPWKQCAKWNISEKKTNIMWYYFFVESSDCQKCGYQKRDKDQAK